MQTFALLAAQRLVNRGIQLRKQYVGASLKADKKICELDIKTHHDFGEGVHSVSSEPYYYESAYDFDFEPGVMVADSCGQCYYKDMKYVSGKTGGTWKCTAKCKALTQFEVDTVLEFKSYFESHCMMLCLCCPCVMMTVLTHIILKFVILMRVMCSAKATVYCVMMVVNARAG